MKSIKHLLALASLLTVGFLAPAWAEPLRMKMTTDIPAFITTPDSVETRLGTLNFFDGFPDDTRMVPQVPFLKRTVEKQGHEHFLLASVREPISVYDDDGWSGVGSIRCRATYAGTKRHADGTG